MCQAIEVSALGTVYAISFYNRAIGQHGVLVLQDKASYDYELRRLYGLGHIELHHFGPSVVK